jgi:hypothetical protein
MRELGRGRRLTATRLHEAGALAFTRSGWLDVEVYEDEILKRFGGL